MPKRTKAELILIRDSTYKELPPDQPMCMSCRHYWGYTASRCDAITIRGEIVPKTVQPTAICDLFEPKQQGST